MRVRPAAAALLAALMAASAAAEAPPTSPAAPAQVLDDVEARAAAAAGPLAPGLSEDEAARGLKSLSAMVPKGQRSEIDYAFFLALARSTTVGDKIEPAARRLQDAQIAAGRRLTPAERRRVIGRLFAELAGDRGPSLLGRGVAFYVDALSPERLSAAERAAWERLGEPRASSFGLSDERVH